LRFASTFVAGEIVRASVADGCAEFRREWGASMAETIALGRTEVLVPRLGLGVMTWGQATGVHRIMPAKIAYGGTKTADEQAAFEASMAAEVNFFDTAAMYSGGGSERRLGELAEGKTVVVATKFPPRPISHTEDLPAAVDASLGNLRRTSIDLYQHHFPSSRFDIRELMGLMADAVEAGKVRAIGVSNYSATQMRTAYEALAQRGIPLASNQVQYSLLYRQPEVDGVLDACRELGITLIAYQPLASGALTGKYLDGPRPVGLRRFRSPFRRADLHAVRPVVQLLRKIGERYGKTPGQVALGWLLAQEGVVPIPGAKSANQAAHNAGALSFRLTPAEIAELDQATTAWRK
jgi:aryl-alcohol dehydrogenase-like predicted oxidoreductase